MGSNYYDINWLKWLKLCDSLSRNNVFVINSKKHD